MCDADDLDEWVVTMGRDNIIPSEPDDKSFDKEHLSELLWE